MRTLIYSLVFVSTAFSTYSLADTLRIPVTQQGAQLNTELPKFGDSLNRILSRYGEPKKRHPSVGQPPITRWDYENFSVYFENQTVINSVKQHQPKAPKH